jgi:hypothetical protein
VTLIIDGLLVAAAAFAGTYCFVLARRVRALKDLDSGIGGAITRMTRALEDARRALEDAKNAGSEEHRDLKQLVSRAETASAQLRVLLAATRDLPAPEPARRPNERSAPRAAAPAAADDVWPEDDGETQVLLRRDLHRPLPQVAAARKDGTGRATPDEAHDAVPQPARLVRPASALLRSPGVAAPAAMPAGEADLLAALAEFAATGRA